LRTEGAKTDPEGKRAEEENALLGEESDEQQRNGGADQCPDYAIEALRQDRPALLRLRDDEDGEQRPIGFVKVEGERDKQSDQARRRRLGREYPRNRVGPGERFLPVLAKRGVDAVRPIVPPRALPAYNIGERSQLRLSILGAKRISLHGKVSAILNGVPLGTQCGL
jgi:hypothetical protein